MKKVASLLLALAVIIVLLPVSPVAADDTYTVTVTAAPGTGGVVSGGGTYGSGDAASLRATPNPGYRFDGWYEGNEQATSDPTYSFTVVSDRSFQARFTETAPQASPTPPPPPPASGQYTITYNANGGSGAPAQQTKTGGTPLTLSNTRPTRSGNLFFLGWATNDNARAPQYYPGSTYTVDANVTLYAIWEYRTGLPTWPVLPLALFGVLMLVFGKTLLYKRKK